MEDGRPRPSKEWSSLRDREAHSDASSGHRAKRGRNGSRCKFSKVSQDPSFSSRSTEATSQSNRPGRRTKTAPPSARPARGDRWQPRTEVLG